MKMTALHPAALAAALVLAAVALAAAKSTRPVRAGLVSVLSGLGALGAVNLLADFTGVALALNGLSWFAACVLGIPGVTLLLMLRLLFGCP